jgi:uncharacterized protein (TIGR01589 family)
MFDLQLLRAVWKQLEEQNPAFFQEYYKALAAQVISAMKC